jgi:two-component system, sensor histidine kinase and response regulator
MKRFNSTGKFKILIVDDVAKNIQLVANFLTQYGYEVNFALDGSKAIEHARHERFDLILLDVMMPILDGFEVCRKLKEIPETANIPVIFLTAKTDEESIAKGFEVGGVDYIVKPFNIPELLARVKTHIYLRLREQELTTLNKTKDTFLSIIGHDVKSPVANIVSLGELLLAARDELSEPEQKELLEDIVESGRQGIWLLENLLSWTRIQTGKISYDPQDIDVSELINRSIGFIQSVADRKAIQIRSKCEDGIQLFSDVNILNTILRNLLSNAIKFTPGEGKIEVEAWKGPDKSILFSIMDNGIGIAPERLDNLFESTGQGSTPGTQNEKGSGLGLSLVKDLCDMIHAEIQVESRVGEGTKFTICFNIGEKE